MLLVKEFEPVGINHLSRLDMPKLEHWPIRVLFIDLTLREYGILMNPLYNLIDLFFLYLNLILIDWRVCVWYYWSWCYRLENFTLQHLSKLLHDLFRDPVLWLLSMSLRLGSHSILDRVLPLLLKKEIVHLILKKVNLWSENAVFLFKLSFC